MLVEIEANDTHTQFGACDTFTLCVCAQLDLISCIQSNYVYSNAFLLYCIIQNESNASRAKNNATAQQSSLFAEKRRSSVPSEMCDLFLGKWKTEQQEFRISFSGSLR